jgi:hypothetical protein
VSGKSVEAFAAQHELPAARLRYWQKALTSRDDKPAESPAPAMLPVRVMQSSRPPIELVLAGCVVRVSRGFDEETLLRLITLLGSR